MPLPGQPVNKNLCEVSARLKVAQAAPYSL